jgi:hypothetical protein
MDLNDPNSFTAKFLEKFLQDGLGAMSKRDIEVLVFHLLLEDGRYQMPADMFKACRELRLTEAKVRNLYQAAQIKYKQFDENEAKRRFVQVVERGEVERKGDRLIFIVRDPLLRQYFEEWVADQGGFTDSSFNKNLVSVSLATFEKILGQLAEFDLKAVQQRLDGELAVLVEARDRAGLIRMFAEEFAKSAGNEAGAMTMRGVVFGLRLLGMDGIGG